MAAKKPTSDETPKDSAEGAAETAAAPKPGGGLKPVLISSAILAVVMGGIGFALAYFVVPSRLQPATVAAATTTPAGTNAAPLAAAPAPAAVVPAADEKTKLSADDPAANGGKPVTKFTLDDITVNIADTRGNRFVRAAVYFVAEPPVLEELEANRARMIDTVGQVLSTQTLDDLTSPNIRGTLRQQLLGIINPTLKQGHIENLYFTDLLVQ
jgi:flagellar basal body-associated protein FliL